MKIKSLLLSAFAALMMPALAQAQPIVKNVLPVKFDLGIKVAANFANMHGEEWESGYKPGIAGGIFGGVRFKRFGVSADVLFSQVKYVGNGVSFYNAVNGKNLFKASADSATHGEFVVTYLSIPVLLNVKLAGPLWFQVGPQFSNIIGIKDKDQLLKDAKDVFKSGDVGGVIGLQLNLASLRVGARYVIGFSDLSNESLSSSWKQRTIQLQLGWAIL